ncbi:hypothetical protein ACFL1R_09255 [Candidatus Latescibacterota bacterium]
MTIMALGLAYPLGVMVDRVADFILSLEWIDKVVIKFGRGFAERDLKYEDPRLRLLVEEKRTTELLDYIRSSVRVVRTCMLNILLIAGFGSALAFTHSCRSLGFGIIGVGFVSFLISFVIFSGSDQTYRLFVKRCDQLAT